MRKLMRPGWLLDEVANAGRENLDPDHVARYDGKMDAGAPEEVERLRRFGLNEDSVVVDIGAGTGQFALEVAKVARRVVAVDVSPVMLERLRAKTTGVSNLEVVQAGFLTYEHQGDPADFVYSRYVHHHLPDFWKAVAFNRVHAMLRPGGVFRFSDAVYNFEAIDAADRIEAWCATGGDEIEGEWSRAELEEHVRDEGSTYTWLLEPMMERTGFAIEDAVYSDDGIFASYILRAT